MVNRVILIGNLGRDPEVRRLESGASVAKLRLATSENYRDRNGEWQTNTEWHDVVLWRAMAERAEASLHKGSLVYVEGKLTHRSWEDQDGNTRYATEVVGSYFRLIRQGRDENAPPPSPQSGKVDSDTAPNAGSGQEDAPVAVTDNNDAEDDLPF